MTFGETSRRLRLVWVSSDLTPWMLDDGDMQVQLQIISLSHHYQIVIYNCFKNCGCLDKYYM